jgi:hypothetical protein
MRGFVLGLACSLLLAPAAAPAQEAGMSDATSLARLVDERRLIEITDAIDSAVDAKDWALTQSYFARRSG